MSKRDKKTIRVFDSFTGIEFPEHRIYATTYEPFWQVVRIRCKFTDDDTIRKSFATLEAYTSLAATENDLRLRLYRVYNMLNAIPIGQVSVHGISHISRGEASLIIPARATFGERLKLLGNPIEWDWHESRKALALIWTGEPKAVESTLKSLTNRARREGKPELRYYIKLIEEISSDLTPRFK